MYRDRTGWKEVVGKITQITGYGFEDLGIADRYVKQFGLTSFGTTETNGPTTTRWDASVETIQQEIDAEKERCARINFSTELNTVPKPA